MRTERKLSRITHIFDRFVVLSIVICVGKTVITDKPCCHK
ncbi:hypothetical protein HMPREF3232_01282 [Fannyhessea vaginae]|nr:hypothetical protein HMPREF3232_01282 [Fannyhessea vaginae]